MPNIRQMINLFVSRRLSPPTTSLATLTDPLTAQTPVSFIRYGDGEWAAILGHRGANCDGHQYGEELGRSLLAGLRHPVNALYGMQPFALKCFGREIFRLVSREKLQLPWMNADLLHDANLTGRLFPFIKALRSRECVIIGPPHLRKLSLFPIAHFIEIPPVNCFDARDEIEHQIRAYGRGKSGVVYLFSASMAANVMIHNLFHDLGSENSLLDIGSLWDIYCGIRSRGVYDQFDWEPIIAQNSGLGIDLF